MLTGVCQDGKVVMNVKKSAKVASASNSRKTKSIPESLPYFTLEGLRFLRGLARNNHRDWFNARKPIYEAEIKRPMLALIEAVTSAMMDFAPGHVRPPEAIMMRIYRDTRFSPNKQPYKTHTAAWWAHGALAKTSGAGFYLHVSGSELMVAIGAYMPDPEQLLAIRRHLMEHHQQYRKLAQARPFRRLFTEEHSGRPLTRSPKGFPAEHPAAALYRQKQWAFSASLPAIERGGGMLRGKAFGRAGERPAAVLLSE